MKHRSPRIINNLVVLFLVVLLTGSASLAAAPPHPSGPNLEEVSGPLSEHGIVRLFVTTREGMAGRWLSDWPSSFPSGTEKLELLVGFNRDPAWGTSLLTRIQSEESGPVPLQEQGAPGRFHLSGMSEFFMSQDIVPVEGAFTKGTYTCVVSCNGVDVARLAWTIEDPVKQPEEESVGVLEESPQTGSAPGSPHSHGEETSSGPTASPPPDEADQPGSGEAEAPLFSPAKVELQQLYTQFLAQEGYRPSIDKDGDVAFKHEGKTVYIFVDEKDAEFFRMVQPHIWSVENETERLKVLLAINATNRKFKVSKVYLNKDSVWASVELFVNEPKDFQQVFARALRALGGASSDLVSSMQTP